MVDRPHPPSKKPHESWRDAMLPEESAAFDAGKYNHGATATVESDRISRDNRLERLTSNTATARDSLTPEQSVQAVEYVRAFQVIATIPQSCVNCGESLPGRGEKRNMSLHYPGNNGLPRGSVCCPTCFHAAGVEPKLNDLIAKLPKLDQKISQLLKDGLTQKQIAARLTNGAQRVTQQMVSKTKQKISRLMKESRRSGYAVRL
jgi:hypothetical protein